VEGGAIAAGAIAAGVVADGVDGVTVAGDAGGEAAAFILAYRSTAGDMATPIIIAVITTTAATAGATGAGAGGTAAIGVDTAAGGAAGAAAIAAGAAATGATIADKVRILESTSLNAIT
jgi:hypothetical protein